MENIPWKRILIAVGFVALVVFFAYLLYVLFFRPNTSPTPTINEVGGVGGGLPTVGEGQPGTVTPPTGLQPGESNGTTTAPSPTASGGLTEVTPLVQTATTGAAVDGANVDYYQQSDGKFYRTAIDGTTTSLSDQVFHDVQKVTWSPSRSSAILEYPDGSNIVYNFQTDKQSTLPKHWQEFSFSPAGDKIVFKSEGVDAANNWLGVADATGGQSQAVQALGDNGDRVDVNWSPNKQVIATYHETTAADSQEIYFVGLNGENFRSMTAPGIGFQSQWTPDGAQLLYSVSSGASSYKPTLWIADASGDTIGQNRHSLEVNTWANKCAFASTASIICAVPRTLPDGSGLAPGVADTTPDDLYQINVATGTRQLLATPSSNLTAKSIFVTGDGKTVVVEDTSSSRIYKIAL